MSSRLQLFRSRKEDEEREKKQEVPKDPFARLQAYAALFSWHYYAAAAVGVYVAAKQPGFMRALSNAVGFTYPAYQSFKSIENRQVDYNDHLHWLMYWVVFGLLYIFEAVFAAMLERFTMYFICKVLFLVWCFSLHFGGARKIYFYAIRPMFKTHEETIDARLANAHRVSIQATGEISRVGAQFLGHAAHRITSSMVSNLSVEDAERT